MLRVDDCDTRPVRKPLDQIEASPEPQRHGTLRRIVFDDRGGRQTIAEEQDSSRSVVLPRNPEQAGSLGVGLVECLRPFPGARVLV